MYEELYAPLPDAAAYLARIGLPADPAEPTAERLEELVHAQLTHIPFDDMDVWGRGDCPSLAIADLFDKIVVRRRGGYGFELNSLFCSFLRSQGFDARPTAAFCVGGRDFLPPPAHCAVLVTIGGEDWFCDVGFGGPVPDGALRFDGAVRHGYRLVPEGGFWLLEQITERGPERVMLFRRAETLPVEFIPMNFTVSQQPGSLFRSTLMLNLRLPDGSVTISGDRFRCRTASERIDRTVRDLDDLRELLPRYFGIPADDPPLRELAHAPER